VCHTSELVKYGSSSLARTVLWSEDRKTWKTMGNTLTGDSSSEYEFRRDMLQLMNEPIGTDDVFWENIWGTPRSAVEIFESISPSGARNLIAQQPNNVYVLVAQAVAKMEHFVAYPDPDFHPVILNCVRFLTRVMPFLLETTKERDSTLLHDMFWTVPSPFETATSVATANTNQQQQATEKTPPTMDSVPTSVPPPSPSSSSSSSSGSNAAPSPPPPPPPPTATPPTPAPLCLAKRMIAAMMRMLFLPDFTIDKDRFETLCRPPPRTSDVEQNAGASFGFVNPGHVWQSGVGGGGGTKENQTNVGANARLELNRSELLKLLLTCMCCPLYVEPKDHPVYNDPWMRAICEEESSLQRTLLFSLLNMIVKYDPVGTGVLSYLPWASNALDDPRERHVDTCCHALLVMLDYAVLPPDPSTADATANHPSASGGVGKEDGRRGEDGASGAGETDTTTHETKMSGNTLAAFAQVPLNQYHVHLAAVQEHADFDVMFNGFVTLLNNVPESMRTYIPHSQKQIQSYQEILTIVWQCIDLNPQFRAYIINQKPCEKIILPCLYMMYEYRQLPAYSGLLHLCTFILLHMSGERDFGVALNRPLLYALPAYGLPTMSTKNAPYGTHVDLCIVTFHKMIVDGMVSLQSLYNCMLTILSNISPYIKTMSLVASLKLINLYEIFSSKIFLLKNQNNNQYIFFLLDIFNNIIQYQYVGNYHLIYSMVRKHGKFQALVDLTTVSKTTMAKEMVKPGLLSSRVDEMVVVPKETEGKVARVGKVGKVGKGAKGAKGAKVRKVGEVAKTMSNRFVPTEEWLMSWKSKLPLDVILRLLNHLKPKVEALALSLNGVVNENDISAFIQVTTLVGVLPQPHPIIVRKYQPNKYTSLWFTTYLWGVVYMRNQTIPLWDGNTVTIFTLMQQDGNGRHGGGGGGGGGAGGGGNSQSHIV